MFGTSWFDPELLGEEKRQQSEEWEDVRQWMMGEKVESVKEEDDGGEG